MAISTNKAMLEDMERAITEPHDEGNPFVRDGDATYMRHDEIQLTQKDGVVSVAYRWRGATIYTMRVDCDMAAGQVLTLTGSSGRMLVKAM